MSLIACWRLRGRGVGLCLVTWSGLWAVLLVGGCGGDDSKRSPRSDHGAAAGSPSALGGEAAAEAAAGGLGLGGERHSAGGLVAGGEGGLDAGGEGGSENGGAGPDTFDELEPATGWMALADGRINSDANSGSASSSAPRLAFDQSGSGAAFAIWTGSYADGDDVYVSRFGGDGWTQPLSLTPGSALGIDPQIAADANGNAFAIWRQPDGGRHVIFTARYSVTTSSWSTPQPIEAMPGIDAEAPAISADGDGNVLAIWRMVALDNGQIAGANVAAADLDGTSELASWQLRLPLAVGNAALAGSPRLALNRAGNGFVIWDQNEDGRRVIYAARYARAVGFEPPLKVGFSDFDASSPDVAVSDNGDAVAVWRQRSGVGSWAISLNRFAAIANNWAPVNHELTQHAADVGKPRVASNVDGAFTCAWWQSEDGRRSAFASRGLMKANGEGTWTAGKLIETDERGDVHEPSVAVRKDGTGLVVWAQGRGDNDHIVLATSVAAGWQLGRLQQDVKRQASSPFIAALPDSNQALVLWAELSGPAPAGNIVGASFAAQ